MQSEQPFLKEVRFVRYLVSIKVILSFIEVGITMAPYWNQVDALGSIVLLAYLGTDLFSLVLVWQLGRRREWARKMLFWLAYLGCFSAAGWMLQLAVGPVQGNMLYKIYYYGIRIIYALLNAFLLSSLTRFSVRNACQVKPSRTSACDIPHNAQ